MRFTIRATLVLAILATALTASAAPANGLMDLVRTRYGEMMDTVRVAPDKEAMRAGLRKIMDSFVDYDELSRLTLAGHWGTLKPKQRKAFVAEFKQMIQRTYVRRFDNDREFTIEYRGDPVTDEKGVATLESVVRSGRSEARVDYAFHRKGKTWMAHDVVIDEVSMVRNYRKQFHDIIGKEGFDGLMTRLVKRNQDQANR